MERYKPSSIISFPIEFILLNKRSFSRNKRAKSKAGLDGGERQLNGQEISGLIDDAGRINSRRNDADLSSGS